MAGTKVACVASRPHPGLPTSSSKLPRSIIPKKESLGTHYVHSGVTESSVHMNEMELFFAFIRNQNLQEQFQYELALYSLTSHSPKAPSFDRNPRKFSSEKFGVYAIAKTRRQGIVRSLSTAIGIEEH